MNSCEIVSFVTAASCAIANCVPREDLPLVAAIFSQISSTLATITVNEDIIHPKETPGGAARSGATPNGMTPGQGAPDGGFQDIVIPPDASDILTVPPVTIQGL